MTEKEFQELVEKVGKEAAELIKADMQKAEANILAKAEAFLKEKGLKIEDLKDLNKEQFDALSKSIAENVETLKTLSQTVTEMKENGTNGQKTVTFENAVKEVIASDKFKAYAEGGYKGRSGAIELKTVDLAADYTGSNILISTQSNRVLDNPANRRLNMRDLIPVMGTDLPFHVYPEVYDWDKNVAMKTENGTLNESAFKVREKQTGTKRLGTYIKISKRMLKSVKWLVAHLSAKLPDALKFVEDFQILFGDGNGNNLDGIARNASAFDLTYKTYSATAFSSIAQYGTNGSADDNTLATFAAKHELSNGDVLTVANSTGATYNGDHIVTVVNATQVLLNQKYTADANVAANWTGSAKSSLYHAIDGAQQIDVLVCAIALLNRAEYMASGIVVNPVEAAKIRLIKSTDEDYVKNAAIEIRNGVTYINNVPVMETSAMPAGYFLVGDFQKAVELLELTAMTVEFADDVTYKLNNEIAAIIQEEIILPIYNKYMFIYGDFATAQSELETA